MKTHPNHSLAADCLNAGLALEDVLIATKACTGTHNSPDAIATIRSATIDEHVMAGWQARG